MHETLEHRFRARLAECPPTDPQYVPRVVDALLASAREVGASDIHLRPTADSLQMVWRVDGVLQPVTDLPAELAPKVIARLKVLANLLTYRTEVPQEGRLRENAAEIETRLSTFPTMFGEKAVVRLFAETGRYHRLDDLNLPAETRDALARLLDQTGGVILFTGPAGSGKTTTIYACLREILDKSRGRRSLVSLEDPIEVVVDGVDQSQLNPAAGFDMQTGLRSLVRQDPEVMMVGEIRDHTTAEIVFQASLTGHLVLTTFHAGSAATAISRLSDMGIEPYLLRSGILAIVCQRLLRRLCACRREAADPEAKLGLPVARAFVPAGCQECAGTGYHGRMVVTEMIEPGRSELGRAILSRSDSGHLEKLAIDSGMVSQYQRACQAVENGSTSPEEVVRVYGTSRQGLNEIRSTKHE